MRIDLQFRLSAIGMIGLAALSATHELRDRMTEPEPLLALSLGVMPNLAAAFGMPLILASFMTPAAGLPDASACHRAFRRVLAFTTLGLCGWELAQTTNPRFVFDVADLIATGLGSALAYLAFTWQLRRARAAHPGHGPT